MIPVQQARLLLSLCFLSVLSLSLFCSKVASQTQSSHPIPPADSKLIEIKVIGSKRFDQEAVAAASGLQLGTTVDDEVFRKAARQLGESGAFNDISYSFTYSSAGTKVTFQVTDADKFVPAHFGDFVWFPERELPQKIHERAPLFDGKLPASGRLPDQVSDILQAMLVENGIPGHVEYLKSTDKGGKLNAIDYTVANIVIKIHGVEFPGSGTSELPELKAAAGTLEGRDYYHALLQTFVDHSLLPIYRQRGYLKATCAPPQPRVVKPATDSSADPREDRREITWVDVTIAVTPGQQYKLKGWEWSGNKNIPAEELQPLIRTKAGQVANSVQLEDDLRSVQLLYGSRGFVAATIKADAAYDDAASEVTFQLVVTEGAVYHMGELEFRGIDNNLTARLRAAWKLRPGDVYDANYLKEFLPQARKLLPRTLDWDVVPHVTAMAKDKTVDVDLQYSAKAPQ